MASYTNNIVEIRPFGLQFITHEDIVKHTQRLALRRAIFSLAEHDRRDCRLVVWGGFPPGSTVKKIQQLVQKAHFPDVEGFLGLHHEYVEEVGGYCWMMCMAFMGDTERIRILAILRSRFEMLPGYYIIPSDMSKRREFGEVLHDWNAYNYGDLFYEDGTVKAAAQLGKI